MINLTAEILTAKRKKLFGHRPIFERDAFASETDVSSLESELQCAIPSDLRYWLVTAGFGDFDQSLSIRANWFNRFNDATQVQLVTFARDELFDMYAFDALSGSIYFISMHELYFAKLADSFRDFLVELMRRDFKLVDWTTGPGLDCIEFGG